jgi:hypothetical protein
MPSPSLAKVNTLVHALSTLYGLLFIAASMFMLNPLMKSEHIFVTVLIGIACLAILDSAAAWA